MKLMKMLYLINLLLLVIFLTNTMVLAQTINKTEQLQKADRLAKSIQLGDDNPVTFYNAACYYALAGKPDEAFQYLEQAVARGYTDVAQMQKDSDLDLLRAEARWQKLIAKAEAKIKEQQSIFWNKKEFWDNPVLKTAYQANISEDEKLAGLSKLWSEIKYNFVNFDLVPEVNWDAMLLEYTPRVRNTKTTLEYYRVLQEMTAKLKDGHTDVFAPQQLSAEMFARPAIFTRLIEDKVIITDVFDETLKQNGIAAGQEITEIDGVPVKQYAEKNVMPYESASTKQSLDVRVYEFNLLNGSAKNPIELTVKNADGKVSKNVLPRITNNERNKLLSNKLLKLTKPGSPFEFKMLPGNIAYVALNGFGDNRAAEMFEAQFDEIAKADRLIIDVRENGGGNSGVGWRVLSYLTDKPFPVWDWYTRQNRPTLRAWGRPENSYGKQSDVREANGKKVYTKPVVVLTSPRTFSAAEDFLTSFVLMKRGIVIGEATGGSTGQPLFFGLPGGGMARVCTMRVKFPDGREWIGKGIQPDKAVAPTVADFRAGRDTVLEAALKELNK